MKWIVKFSVWDFFSEVVVRPEVIEIKFTRPLKPPV